MSKTVTETLSARLQAEFKGSLRKASDKLWHTHFLQTGILGLDHALGGGFGYGRAAELLGSWSTGKTMLLYYALIANQKRGGLSMLGEAEGAFTPDFFAELGGDPDTLLVEPVDTVEQFFNFVKKTCDMIIEAKDPTPVAIGWDSIAATGTDHIMETGMGTRDMSKPAMMSDGCKLIRTRLSLAKVALIATNQVSMKIGDWSHETNTPGGLAYKFLCSQRVEMEYAAGPKKSLMFSGTKEVGRMVEGKVIKNKLAAPFETFKIPIYVRTGDPHPMYDGCTTKKGIDKTEALFHALAKGAVRKDKELIVMPNGPRYVLNPKCFGDVPSFFAKDWPKIVEAHPELWTIAQPEEEIDAGRERTENNSAEVEPEESSTTTRGRGKPAKVHSDRSVQDAPA